MILKETEALFEDVESYGTAEMAFSKEWAGAIDLSEVKLVEVEAKSFSELALSSAKEFKEWFTAGFVKGWTFDRFLAVGLGGLMIYQLVQAHAKQASSSGVRIKLSSAIDGTKKTLVDYFDKTFGSVAKKALLDPKFPTWSKDVQDAVRENAAMTGDIYWITVGKDIMAKLAEMPIYDPTPA